MKVAINSHILWDIKLSESFLCVSERWYRHLFHSWVGCMFLPCPGSSNPIGIHNARVISFQAPLMLKLGILGMPFFLCLAIGTGNKLENYKLLSIQTMILWGIILLAAVEQGFRMNLVFWSPAPPNLNAVLSTARSVWIWPSMWSPDGIVRQSCCCPATTHLQSTCGLLGASWQRCFRGSHCFKVPTTYSNWRTLFGHWGTHLKRNWALWLIPKQRHSWETWRSLRYVMVCSWQSSSLILYFWAMFSLCQHHSL